MSTVDSTSAGGTLKVICPVLFGFFVMGFVDVVGISSNYAKLDFSLSDTLSNLLPMSVFLCFALFSIPTGILMGKIGKRNTVLLSLSITAVAMLLPLCWYNFYVLLAAFGLLGVGNTILQVSLNPMIAQVVHPQKVPSILTAGQFIKAIASFLGPILAAWAVASTGSWKNIFLVYAVATGISLFWLLSAVGPSVKTETERTATFSSTFVLFKDRFIVILFLGILCVVGIDVGLNTSLPKLFMAKCGLSLETAGYSTSVYFAARTAGALFGTFFLARYAANRFYTGSAVAAILGFILLILLPGTWTMYVMTVVVGFSCANMFPIIFSYALRHKQGQDNEVSALMIMGVSGGALFLPVVGTLSDMFGQVAGISFLGICLIFLFFVSLQINQKEKEIV